MIDQRSAVISPNHYDMEPQCYLRVQEVHNGDEGQVENCPDDVKFPFEVRNSDGSDFNDHTTEQSQ